MARHRAYIRELQRCLASESVWQPDSAAQQRLSKLIKAQRTVMMLFMRVRQYVSRHAVLSAQHQNTYMTCRSSHTRAPAADVRSGTVV